MAAIDDNINISVTGSSGLDKYFYQLTEKIRKNATRKGVRAANKVFREAGKKNAPKGHGKRLSRSVKSKVSTKFGIVTGTTGIKAGKGSKYDAWYANFVEYGTKQRVTIKKIYNPKNKPTWWRTDASKVVPPISLKSCPATRFMKKTYLRNEKNAISAFQKPIKWAVLTTYDYQFGGKS